MTIHVGSHPGARLRPVIISEAIGGQLMREIEIALAGIRAAKAAVLAMTAPVEATIYCGRRHESGEYCELDYGHPGTCAYTSASGEEVTWRAPAQDGQCDATWQARRGVTWWCTLDPGHHDVHQARAGSMLCATWDHANGIEYPDDGQPVVVARGAGPAACPSVSPDGDACAEAGAHQFHRGPDDDGMHRMWTDADARLASLGQAQDAALATAAAASDRLAEAIRGGPPVTVAEDAPECGAEAEGRACTLPPHGGGEHCDADGWRWAGVPGAVPHRQSAGSIAGDEPPCGLRLWGDTALCELPAGHDPLPSCKGTPRPFARPAMADVLLAAAELDADMREPDPSGDDPEPGSQAYADKYASRTVQRGLQDPAPVARVLDDGERPATWMACGDSLEDDQPHEPGSPAECPRHGQTYFISEAQWLARVPPEHGGELPRRVVSLDSRMGFVSRLDGAKVRTGGES